MVRADKAPVVPAPDKEYINGILLTSSVLGMNRAWEDYTKHEGMAAQNFDLGTLLMDALTAIQAALDLLDHNAGKPVMELTLREVFNAADMAWNHGCGPDTAAVAGPVQ